MTAAHFGAIVQAETRKLLSRSSARFGLGFALVVGFAIPLFAALFRYLATQSVQDPSMVPPMDPSYVVYATLYLRNFFLMRIVLIMVAALSFAGEFQSRTLREDVLRPVHRSAMLLAKWAALVVWIAISLVFTLLPATAFSIAAWGTGGDWTDVLLGWVATLLSDAGFAALALAMAVVLRSVAGTMVGMFLFYFANVGLGFALAAISAFPFLDLPQFVRDAATGAGPYLPPAAYDVWQGASPGAAWSIEGFAALLIYGTLSWIVADRVFSRIDVP